MSPIPQRMMLKPAQLQLLTEIAEHGQLKTAAESCGMTQPAASRMLAQTETQIGAPLFTRHPKGMEPTEIGQNVLRRARVILREMFTMASETEDLRRGLAGAVHVGAVTGPAVGYLVGAIREIKEQAPEADITVNVLPSRDLLAHLTAGEMDFALGRILPEFDSNEFNLHPISDEEVLFLVRKGHPLAGAAEVTLPELAAYEWIMQQRGSPVREAALQAFAGLGLPEPRNIVNSPSVLLTIAYLAQGDAVAPVSAEVAELLINPPVSAGFTTLPVRIDVRVAPYYLLDLRRRPLSPLAQRLRQLVIQHSGKRP